jgi:Bacterial TniB protein
MNDLLRLVDKILVPHPKFDEALHRIEQCYTFAEEVGEPSCLAVIGEARTGKTRALKACLLRHPGSRLDDGIYMPIVYIKAPAKPTVKGMAELLLEELKDPNPERGTEIERTRRLKRLMPKTRTRLVMIDEFQHFVDKGTTAVMYLVSDWLKILVDDVRCSLVVAGLPRCQAVIDQNEQLAGRFLAPINLSRFRWTNLDERANFIGILGSFHKELREFIGLPELDSDPVAFRFWCATGGLIGYLTKLIRRTVCNAVAKKSDRVTLTDLSVAHRECMWHELGSEAIRRPFDPDFKLEATSDVLTQVLRVGSEVTLPKSARHIDRRKSSRRAMHA